MHEVTYTVVDNPSPEPNAGGTSQAKAAAAQDKTVKAQDKAVRGPKEPT